MEFLQSVLAPSGALEVTLHNSEQKCGDQTVEQFWLALSLSQDHKKMISMKQHDQFAEAEIAGTQPPSKVLWQQFDQKVDV